jgi:hypothetical protein
MSITLLSGDSCEGYLQKTHADDICTSRSMMWNPRHNTSAKNILSVMKKNA